MTRDAADLGQRPLPAPERYWSRSKLESFVGQPSPLTLQEVPGLEGFAARVVVQDHTKAHRAELTSSRLPLVVDLIDERFRLLQSPSGGLVTESLYFNRSGLPDRGYRRAGDDHELDDTGSFAEATRRFGALVADRPVVIHHALWAERDIKGAIIPSSADPALMNRRLDRAYALLASAVRHASVLRAPDGLRLGDPNHRWGLAPFHYSPDYYDWLAHSLRGLCVLDACDPSRSLRDTTNQDVNYHSNTGQSRDS